MILPSPFAFPVTIVSLSLPLSFLNSQYYHAAKHSFNQDPPTLAASHFRKPPAPPYKLLSQSSNPYNPSPFSFQRPSLTHIHPSIHPFTPLIMRLCLGRRSSSSLLLLPPLLQRSQTLRLDFLALILLFGADCVRFFEGGLLFFFMSGYDGAVIGEVRCVVVWCGEDGRGWEG